MDNGNFTILCVDDEATPLYFRKLVLEKNGFHVLTVPSAMQAIQLLANTRVDLVLSDILMPEMPGTELLQRLRKSHPKLPIILVSGLNEVPPEAAQADLFISKLEGPIVMCEKIRQVLQQHQSSHETGSANANASSQSAAL
ncbi:MAG TPA: response regulator [Terriglobales bacterium]|nr:response regulator [Terriglobales bacterium]